MSTKNNRELMVEQIKRLRGELNEVGKSELYKAGETKLNEASAHIHSGMGLKSLIKGLSEVKGVIEELMLRDFANLPYSENNEKKYKSAMNDMQKVIDTLRNIKK